MEKIVLSVLGIFVVILVVVFVTIKPSSVYVREDYEWNEEFQYCYAMNQDLCEQTGGQNSCAANGSPGKSGLEDVCIMVCDFG